MFHEQLNKETVKIGGILVDGVQYNAQYNLVIELGSTLEIEITAEGVPEAVYQWFRLPPGDYCEYSIYTKDNELRSFVIKPTYFHNEPNDSQCVTVCRTTN